MKDRDRIVPGIRWQRAEAKRIGEAQRGFYGGGFGMAVAKGEGARVPFDANAPKGGKPAVGNDWMELPIPKNASRARVHKMVDEWLDGRAKGPRGMGA